MWRSLSLCREGAWARTTDRTDATNGRTDRTTVAIAVPLSHVGFEYRGVVAYTHTHTQAHAHWRLVTVVALPSSAPASSSYYSSRSLRIFLCCYNTTQPYSRAALWLLCFEASNNKWPSRWGWHCDLSIQSILSCYSVSIAFRKNLEILVAHFRRDIAVLQ